MYEGSNLEMPMPTPVPDSTPTTWAATPASKAVAPTKAAATMSPTYNVTDVDYEEVK